MMPSIFVTDGIDSTISCSRDGILLQQVAHHMSVKLDYRLERELLGWARGEEARDGMCSRSGRSLELDRDNSRRSLLTEPLTKGTASGSGPSAKAPSSTDFADTRVAAVAAASLICTLNFNHHLP